MTDRIRRVCTICARGGSKGVRNKNIRPLLGIPLIGHSLRQARASGLFDMIAVSSDSPEILTVAREYGADLLVERPAELATDFAPKVPAIIHCLDHAEVVHGKPFDVIVDLDATAPLRTVGDIAGAVRLLESEGCINVITGAPARRSPYFNLVELGADGAVRPAKTADPPIARRQDAPRCFDMNASIYVWWTHGLRDHPRVFTPETYLFEMPEERSLDIDSELDFELVEFLMKRGQRAAWATEGK